MVAHALETKPVPAVCGHQRMERERVIGARHEAHQSADHEIGERRVVVPAAARVAALEPLAGRFVEILAEIRLPVEAMTAGVGEHGGEVVVGGDGILRRAAEHVGQGHERLRRGERPHGPVPLAGAHAVGAEGGMAAFCRGDAERGTEALLVRERSPGRLVAPAGGRQREVPRNEADRLADVGKRAVLMDHLEERILRVPERVEELLAERLPLFGEGLGLGDTTGVPRDFGERQAAAGHVGVDRGADVLRVAASADRLLHRVANIVLPVETVGPLPLLGPRPVVGDQPVETARHEAGIAGDQGPLPEGMRQPLAVFVEFLVLAGLEPEVDVVVVVDRIAEPTALHEVMAQRRAHRGRPGDELGEHPAAGVVAAEMLPQRPPAEIPDLDEVGIGAVEPRDVGLKPGGRLSVWHRAADVIDLEGIEAIDVSLHHLGPDQRAGGIGWSAF